MMVGFYYASERVIGQHDSRSSERANYKKMSTVTTDKWTTVVGTLLGSKSNRFPTRKQAELTKRNKIQPPLVQSFCRYFLKKIHNYLCIAFPQNNSTQEAFINHVDMAGRGEGGLPNVHFSTYISLIKSSKGEGGQKCPKIHPHDL